MPYTTYSCNVMYSKLGSKELLDDGGVFSYVLTKNLEKLHCSYMLASQLHKPDGHLLI